MQSMVEGGDRMGCPWEKPPSVSASRCHLPVPGRMFSLPAN